jgi:DNA-binding response OmpR family regulator
VKEKILIVARDLDMHKMLLQTFSGNGYQALLASGRVSAVLQIGLHWPDLIILDLALANNSSWETLRQIRAISTAPIIALAHQKDTEIVVTGLNLGADQILSRPFDLRELRARARALLRRAQGRALDLGATTVPGCVARVQEQHSPKRQHGAESLPVTNRTKESKG